MSFVNIEFVPLTTKSLVSGVRKPGFKFRFTFSLAL